MSTVLDRLALWWQGHRRQPRCLSASETHFPPHLCARPKGHRGQHRGARGDWWPR